MTRREGCLSDATPANGAPDPARPDAAAKGGRILRALAAGAVLLAVTAVPLVHDPIPEATEAMQGALLRGLGVAAGIAALAAAALERAAVPAPASERRATALLALLVGLAALSAAASPLAPRLVPDLLGIAAAAGLALATFRVPRALLAATALGSAGLLGALAVVSSAGSPAVVAEVRPTGTLADAETLGVLLGPASAAGLALAAARGGRVAVAALVAAALAAAGTLASLSRGAVLALAAGALLGVAAGGRPRARARSLVAGALVLLLAGALALAVLLATGRGALVRSRVNPLVEVNASVTPSRPALAALALALVRERPLLGHGPGSFPWLAPGATLAARAAGRLGPRVSPWPHAQNDVLEIAATLGLPGAVLLVALGSHSLRAAWRRRDSAAGRVALAALAALAVSMALHHPLESAAGRMVAALGVGLACGAGSEDRERGNASSPDAGVLARRGTGPRHDAARAALVAIALAAFGTAAAALPEDAGLHLRRVRKLAAAGDMGGALALSRRAAAIAPQMPRSRTRLAKAESMAGDLDGAERTLRAVLVTWPQDEPARVLLAEVLLAQGRPGAALAALASGGESETSRRVRELEARARAALAGTR